LYQGFGPLAGRLERVEAEEADASDETAARGHPPFRGPGRPRPPRAHPRRPAPPRHGAALRAPRTSSWPPTRRPTSPASPRRSSTSPRRSNEPQRRPASSRKPFADLQSVGGARAPRPPAPTLERRGAHRRVARSSNRNGRATKKFPRPVKQALTRPSPCWPSRASLTRPPSRSGPPRSRGVTCSNPEFYPDADFAFDPGDSATQPPGTTSLALYEHVVQRRRRAFGRSGALARGREHVLAASR
jgi:hypothetical protein